MRKYVIAATSAAVLAIPAAPFAQQGQLGTADEAKAMLMKAVAAVKADRDVALGMFNKGEGGFRDRDLYVFCSRAGDGKNLAGPISVPSGTDTRTLKDPTGKEFGKELYAAAQKPEDQWPDLAIEIGAGQLDPGSALVDQAAHHPKGGVLSSGWQGRSSHVIKYEWRWQAPY